MKKKRFEISPTIGISIDDAFFQKYAVGLKLAYHVAEEIAIGAHFSYSLNTVGDTVWSAAQGVCRSRRSTSSPTSLENPVISELEGAWAPLYGKINVLAEKVLHFDTAVLLGVSVVQNRAAGGVATISPALHIGLGQRYFLTPSMTLRIEIRDYIYSYATDRAGTSATDSPSKIENQLMLDIGLSFFVGDVPTE